MPVDEVRRALEEAVQADRFSMAGTETAVVDAGEGTPTELLEELGGGLSNRAQRRVKRGLLRASFFIELVKKPDINTTKYALRWTDRLPADDPRYASFEESLDIFAQLVRELIERVQVGENRQILESFAEHNLVAYELPLGYDTRRTNPPIHRADNLTWMDDATVPRRTIRLRELLLGEEDRQYAEVFGAIYDKLQVKTYLTDRVLTGEHKTNREKRWETHPDSVHFGRRHTCMAVEYTLINQVCHFDGFPAQMRERLEGVGVLQEIEEPYRCPVTMEPLSFDDFAEELLDPDHGTASFQVGHLNPLKSGVEAEDAERGHVPENVGWISEEGNRIQGYHSLDETRLKLKQIVSRYEAADI